MNNKLITDLTEVRPGVYVGNIDVTTHSDERFFDDIDRVTQMNELIEKKQEKLK